MSREIVIEEAVIEVFEKRGWYQRKVVFAGVKGSPDRWLLRKGMWVLIEFKRPGEHPDGNQARRHRELREHGQEVYVVDNLADGLKLCYAMTEESDRRAAA